ncbi:hypothetical protein [Flavobacterium noncentrifugens]|uniref:Uncharacterized protein n=1 Tax=Flavobacterium noncentrifugens TaxID=1128970 RepID=A0A1G8WE66_9FLAO|nr:hypothetical protein [Flavobacterium noncentrifugens]SDJ76649.1 hypothetical protein SAMN04487935_1782 [Flavobacterium noncentrifugens]
MDKTNVIIKIPGLLYENDHFINIEEEKLIEKTIELLRSRKSIINVLFNSDHKPATKKVDTLTKVEILLSDETGNFNYYED